jgi:hypothetical protein
LIAAAVITGLFASEAQAADATPRADQLSFRELYKELVETDTCTSESLRSYMRL